MHGCLISLCVWLITSSAVSGVMLRLSNPCDFPVPEDLHRFRRCAHPSSHGYICDIDRVFSDEMNKRIAHIIDKDFYDTRGILVGVLVLSKIILPDFDAVPEMQRPNFCERVPLLEHMIGRFAWNASSAYQYATESARILRSRWFEGDTGDYNFLILLSVGGTVTHDGRHTVNYGPLISIQRGEKLKPVISDDFIEHIEETVPHCLVLKRESYQDIVLNALSLLLRAVRKWEAQMRSDNMHSVPAWALYTFGGCLMLCISALVLDWIVLTRRSLKSTTAGQNGGKNVKTVGLIASMMRKNQGIIKV